MNLRSHSLGLLAAALGLALASLPPAPAQSGKKDKQGGGPKLRFAPRVPKHLLDIVLARPTARSVTASVLAYEDMECYLSYGTEKGKHAGRTKAFAVKAKAPAEVVVDGLKADTPYYYRLHRRTPGAGEFVAEAEARFHTRRKPGSGFTFTVQADSHLDENTAPAVYERSLANALADGPDFHIDLGDTFMVDKYARHTEALPHYLAQRYYLGKLAHSCPLFLVLGNHDGERGDRHDGTEDSVASWSCRNRKKYFPNPYPDGFYSGNKAELKQVGRLEDYYAWEWGDALFIVLDPFWPTNKRSVKREGNWGLTLGDEQYSWLRKALEGSKAKFKFVFIHHLVGGAGRTARGGTEAAALFEWGGKGATGKDEFKKRRPGWAMPIHALLVKHKVSAVFHGHDHFFAHQELDGILYQLVPQPGHPGFDRLRSAHEYGYLRGDFLPPSGHVRVRVSKEKAVVEYVRAYLPRNEAAGRKNGMVAHTHTIRPAK